MMGPTSDPENIPNDHYIAHRKYLEFKRGWLKYYDEKGQLMRTLNYKNIKKFGSRRIPSVMELIPTKKEGHKTVIRYIEASFDLKVDKGIFSLRHLRSRI